MWTPFAWSPNLNVVCDMNVLSSGSQPVVRLLMCILRLGNRMWGFWEPLFVALLVRWLKFLFKAARFSLSVLQLMIWKDVFFFFFFSPNANQETFYRFSFCVLWIKNIFQCFEIKREKHTFRMWKYWSYLTHCGIAGWKKMWIKFNWTWICFFGDCCL